jgi:hypothetical protein
VQGGRRREKVRSVPEQEGRCSELNLEDGKMFSAEPGRRQDVQNWTWKMGRCSVLNLEEGKMFRNGPE